MTCWQMRNRLKVEHLRAKRVTFRIEPMATAVCRMAMIFDPDGNTICIHKRNAGR
jgi:hypothetical protein